MKVMFDYNELKHIKEKSYYNNNYYEILNFSEWLLNVENLILYQHYDEFSNCVEYHLGVFDDKNKFNSFIIWSEYWDCDELKDILEKVDKNATQSY